MAEPMQHFEQHAVKNRYTAMLALLIVIIAGLGCGLVERIQTSDTPQANANYTWSDTPAENTAASGEPKIGVPECDEVMDMLAAEANSPDDNFVTKAVKSTVLNRMKDAIRTSVEENQNDKAELAKTCKEFKAQLLKYKAEEQKKKANP